MWLIHWKLIRPNLLELIFVAERFFFLSIFKIYFHSWLFRQKPQMGEMWWMKHKTTPRNLYLCFSIIIQLEKKCPLYNERIHEYTEYCPNPLPHIDFLVLLYFVIKFSICQIFFYFSCHMTCLHTLIR